MDHRVSEVCVLWGSEGREEREEEEEEVSGWVVLAGLSVLT